jgi:hypothetical protein
MRLRGAPSRISPSASIPACAAALSARSTARRARVIFAVKRRWKNGLPRKPGGPRRTYTNTSWRFSSAASLTAVSTTLLLADESSTAATIGFAFAGAARVSLSSAALAEAGVRVGVARAAIATSFVSVDPPPLSLSPGSPSRHRASGPSVSCRHDRPDAEMGCPPDGRLDRRGARSKKRPKEELDGWFDHLRG